jgi:two-component system cell cycle sensor histidine kinase PleC
LSGGRIDVTAGIAPNGWLKLSVRDSGVGIRQEDIPKALQPYEQIESEIPRRHDGTGLGLPISRELVVLQGGEFSLASTPGEGTTVMMRFPPERLVNLPVQLDLPGHGDGKLPAA